MDFQEDDAVYDWISCLMPDHLYFGPFPNQKMIDALHREGFDVILNLTIPGEEKAYALPEGVEYICYPIPDNRFPLWISSYTRMITQMKYKCLSHKVYIHCRGGHGRSGMVSTSIVYAIYPYDLRESITFVNQAHNDREILRKKWKKRNSPFNYDQYTFLLKIHKNIYINTTRANKYYEWLYPVLADGTTTLCQSYVDHTSFEKMYQEIEAYLLDPKNKIRLYQTHLKKIVITDSPYPEFSAWYSTIVWHIREFFLS